MKVPSATDNVVKVPQPAATELPVNEKPRTVEPAACTTKPELAASPPEAPFTVAPSTLN